MDVYGTPYIPPTTSSPPASPNLDHIKDPKPDAHYTPAQWKIKYQQAMEEGDGNEMIDLIIKGLKDGLIDMELATALTSQSQQVANQNGGGIISKGRQTTMHEILGDDYIVNGKTRGQIGAEEFFGGIGEVFEGMFGIR